MAEARATCLEQTRARGSRRLLSKTDKERANRSELRRASTRHHLASQMDEDKAARLLHAREGKRRGGQTDLAETTCFRQMRLRAVSESDHETDTRLESAAQLKGKLLTSPDDHLEAYPSSGSTQLDRERHIKILRWKSLLAPVPTSTKMPPSRLEFGAMPVNRSGSAALPARNEHISSATNIKTLPYVMTSQSCQLVPSCTITEAKCTSPKMPLPRPKSGGTSISQLASTALPVREKSTPSSPNSSKLQSLAMSSQLKPLCSVGDPSLPNESPLLFVAPCNPETASSPCEVLSLSTHASSCDANIPGGPVVAFDSPSSNVTDTANEIEPLCPLVGTRSHGIQLSSVPTTLLTTPFDYNTQSSQPAAFNFPHELSSSEPQQPSSAPAVVFVTPSAAMQLLQSALLSLSGDPELANVPRLTTPCQTEVLHCGTPETSVTFLVPVKPVFAAERPSLTNLQATQCKPNTYRVPSVSRPLKAGHRRIVKATEGTQTPTTMTHSMITQTKPKKLRNQGTNTSPEEHS
ncbi:uncharacterized protein LOC119395882 [Rhipicephalus sanguineus]|uniref:uncharacterized protein LOC119395882 n=1 Tax=Rhipicephalus sanguineus TaxID=34632 RepID=UPI0018954846|nr:uncharacterized protein LOC119395882 [Rhipicephalus sanguineus]